MLAILVNGTTRMVMRQSVHTLTPTLSMLIHYAVFAEVDRQVQQMKSRRNGMLQSTTNVAITMMY